MCDVVACCCVWVNGKWWWWWCSVQIDVACGADLLRVQFWRTDVVRVWLAWGGNFSDPATADIITGAPSATLRATVTDKGDYYEFAAADTSSSSAPEPEPTFRGRTASTTVTLRATKSPLKFTLVDAKGAVLWSEAQPLSHNSTATFQTLAPAAANANANNANAAASAEAFFGGGMQNGRFVHTGTRIRISKDFNWADGGNPNSAPWYVRSGQRA